MQRPLIILSVFLGSVGGSRVGHPNPGTETILLVKGGYGPGLNLISTAPATTKRRHGVQKAPMDRTEKEEAEVKDLETVGKVVSTLQTQISEVGQETAKVLSETEASRVERAELNDKLVADTAKVDQLQSTDSQLAQLQAQAQQLRSQITAEKANTAAEKARSSAFASKVTELEKNVHTLSKAWSGLAKHEGLLAKAAQQELDAKTTPAAQPAPVAPKKAAAAPKKAAVPSKKVAHAKHTEKNAAAAKAPAKVQKKDTTAKVVAEDDITDDVLASDSDDDVDEDATQADKDSDSDSDDDSQASDDSDGY